MNVWQFSQDVYFLLKGLSRINQSDSTFHLSSNKGIEPLSELRVQPKDGP